MEIKSILNLLTILKEEPKCVHHFPKFRAFYSWNHLYGTIEVCLKAGFIRTEYFGKRKSNWEKVTSHNLHKDRQHCRKVHFYLTDSGLALLSFYSRHKDWQVKKVNKERKESHSPSTERYA